MEEWIDEGRVVGDTPSWKADRPSVARDKAAPGFASLKDGYSEST